MKLGDILYELKVCNPEKLIKAIAEILGTKGMILSRDVVKLNLTDYFSLDVAKRNKAVPIEVENGKIKICFPTTINNRNMDTIRLLVLNKGLIMDPYITFSKDIDAYLSSLEGGASENIAETSGTITGLVDSIIKTGMKKEQVIST